MPRIVTRTNCSVLERKTIGKLRQDRYRWPFDLFIQEIRDQCNMAIIAFDDLVNIASKKPQDNDRFWYSIHGFLSATGNVSKLLSFSDFTFRKNSSLFHLKERNKSLKNNLRCYCRVSPDSIIMQRKFRNHYEHYDERLFEWAMDDHTPMMHYRIGTPDMLRSQLDLSEDFPIKVLKCFDPTTFSLLFYEEKINIENMYEEIKRIKKRAETYLKY